MCPAVGGTIYLNFFWGGGLPDIQRRTLRGVMEGSVGEVGGGVEGLEVDQVDVGGGEVGAQSHVRVLQLS